MKITVYTIKDCAFSKQEKEYLNTNKLVFEEKDLETNKEFLTEMLAISNNFAGTPVTRVEKDDGTISVLKGFTKDEFDITFGFSVAPAPVAASPKDQPTKPLANVPPAAEATQPPVQTVSPTPAETTDKVPTSSLDLSATKDASTVADSLQSVMDSLQSKSQDTKSVDAEPAPTAPPVAEQPTTTPTTVDQTAPTIPNFPAK